MLRYILSAGVHLSKNPYAGDSPVLPWSRVLAGICLVQLTSEASLASNGEDS